MKKVLILILIAVSIQSFGQNKKYGERLNANLSIDSFYTKILLLSDSVFAYSNDAFVAHRIEYYERNNLPLPAAFSNFTLGADGVYRNFIQRSETTDWTGVNNKPSTFTATASTVGTNILAISNPASASLIRVNSNGTVVTRTVTEAKQDLSIDNVDNTSDANKPVSSATQTALNLKANLASPTFTGTVGGITATMVGLGNVNNTSDANKPISTATQTALDGKQATLVSGENIKTVNNISIVGSGNIPIAGGEAFPVGSVFISVVATNPNTLLGYGTWEAFAPGRMLVGFDNTNPNFDVAEETGGSATVTITADNLPQLSVSITDPGHTHVQNKNTTTTGPLSGTTPDASTNTSAPSGYSTEPATTGITATANTGGANNSITILNPYITVYMWKRTN